MSLMILQAPFVCLSGYHAYAPNPSGRRRRGEGFYGRFQALSTGAAPPYTRHVRYVHIFTVIIPQQGMLHHRWNFPTPQVARAKLKAKQMTDTTLTVTPVTGSIPPNTSLAVSMAFTPEQDPVESNIGFEGTLHRAQNVPRQFEYTMQVRRSIVHCDARHRNLIGTMSTGRIQQAHFCGYAGCVFLPLKCLLVSNCASICMEAGLLAPRT